jgi:hypothetical protein
MPCVFALALLFVVALDFSTADAVLSVVGGGRSVQWDDEEESVPARRQRVSGEERRVAALPVAPRLLEPDRTRPSTERRIHADRLHGQTRKLLPFKRALTSSVRCVSPLDDH